MCIKYTSIIKYSNGIECMHVCVIARTSAPAKCWFDDIERYIQVCNECI